MFPFVITDASNAHSDNFNYLSIYTVSGLARVSEWVNIALRRSLQNHDDIATELGSPRSEMKWIGL